MELLKKEQISVSKGIEIAIEALKNWPEDKEDEPDNKIIALTETDRRHFSNTDMKSVDKNENDTFQNAAERYKLTVQTKLPQEYERDPQECIEPPKEMDQYFEENWPEILKRLDEKVWNY